MTENRRQVLEMLSAGQITTGEADHLIAAPEDRQPAPSWGDRTELRPSAAPRYLRVLVDMEEEGDGPIRVNVRVPLQLLRAGVRLATDRQHQHPGAGRRGLRREYRELPLRASETDTVYSKVFDGGWPDAPHRTLRKSTVQAWQQAGTPPPGQRPGEDEVVARRADGTDIPRYWVSPPSALIASGSPEAMAVYAGQGVGLVTSVQPARDIVAQLVAETKAALGATAAHW